MTDNVRLERWLIGNDGTNPSLSRSTPTQTGHSPFLKAVIDARSFDHLVGADRRIPSEEIQRIATEGAMHQGGSMTASSGTRRAPPPAYMVYAANRLSDRNFKLMKLDERGL